MGLLDKLVQEEDLDPEVMQQKNSTYLNLWEVVETMWAPQF